MGSPPIPQHGEQGAPRNQITQWRFQLAGEIDFGWKEETVITTFSFNINHTSIQTLFVLIPINLKWFIPNITSSSSTTLSSMVGDHRGKRGGHRGGLGIFTHMRETTIDTTPTITGDGIPVEHKAAIFATADQGMSTKVCTEHCSWIRIFIKFLVEKYLMSMNSACMFWQKRARVIPMTTFTKRIIKSDLFRPWPQYFLAFLAKLKIKSYCNFVSPSHVSKFYSAIKYRCILPTNNCQWTTTKKWIPLWPDTKRNMPRKRTMGGWMNMRPMPLAALYSNCFLFCLVLWITNVASHGLLHKQWLNVPTQHKERGIWFDLIQRWWNKDGWVRWDYPREEKVPNISDFKLHSAVTCAFMCTHRQAQSNFLLHLEQKQEQLPKKSVLN